MSDSSFCLGASAFIFDGTPANFENLTMVETFLTFMHLAATFMAFMHLKPFMAALLLDAGMIAHGQIRAPQQQLHRRLSGV